MVTRNFKNLFANVFQSFSANIGSLPMVSTNGTGCNLSNSYVFPGSRSESFTLGLDTEGISLGTGGTAPTERDINLENTITSGINVSITSKHCGLDDRGDRKYKKPYIIYKLTVTNTSSTDAITLREIGYKQKVKCTRFPGDTSAGDYVCLLDRSLLTPELTVQPEDSVVVTYKLRTLPQPEKTVNGVKIVGFADGTAAEIGAMIDAAHHGLIDLQTDANWMVGDMRSIEVDAFTGGGDVAHAGGTFDIAISSFDDYMGCGSVMTFDFVECEATGQRMNPSNTTTGGYKESEMRTVTIPAMVEALPNWLKSRLLTFSVLAGSGNNGPVETVTGNKLALRSEVEIFGMHDHSVEGEGTQVPLYRRANRLKRSGRVGSTTNWWERSPSGTWHFCFVSSSGGAYTDNATLTYGISPFGCL